MKNLEDALNFLSQSNQNPSPSPSFSDEVNQRLIVMGETAQANVQMAQESQAGEFFNQKLIGLLSAAKAVSNKTQKVFWLRRASDLFGGAMQPFSACKAGCSHCCNIPITLSEVEANAIGKAIGVRPANLALNAGFMNSLKQDEQSGIRVGYDNPCVFLKDGACQIYSERPIVCRTHFNMDADDLLCRLEGDGNSIPVPMANCTSISLVQLTSFEKSKWADVRQWFPRGLAS